MVYSSEEDLNTLISFGSSYTILLWLCLSRLITLLRWGLGIPFVPEKLYVTNAVDEKLRFTWCRVCRAVLPLIILDLVSGFTISIRYSGPDFLLLFFIEVHPFLSVYNFSMTGTSFLLLFNTT